MGTGTFQGSSGLRALGLGAGQRVGDALESTVEGRTASRSCKDMESREEKGLGWLLRGQGVGRREGTVSSLGLPASLSSAQDPFLALPPLSEGASVSPSPDQSVVTPHVLV